MNDELDYEEYPDDRKNLCYHISYVKTIELVIATVKIMDGKNLVKEFMKTFRDMGFFRDWVTNLYCNFYIERRSSPYDDDLTEFSSKKR